MTTYLDLRTEIADELARGDLSAAIPRFVRQATQRINREVRVSDMERRARALGDGTRYLAAPAGMLEMRRMWNIIDTATEAKRYQAIRQVAPQDLRHKQAGGAMPVWFCVTRGDPPEVEFDVPLADDREVEMEYVKRYDEFVNDTDTNFLLNTHSNLYFDAALVEAHKYLRDWDQAAARDQDYRRTLAEVDREERRRKYMQPMAARVTQPVF